MYPCKKCYAKLESHWKACPECGTPVENSAESQSPEDPSHKTVKRASEVYGAVRLDNLPTGYFIDDRYEVKHKLGQGGFGAVYLAYDRKMEVEKALKVIPEVVASDRESMKQLHREAKIMVKLNHPNIVRVYDFNDEGDIKYIDMEYVDGKTLTDLKLEHPDEKLPEAEVVNYAIKIAEAFEYAHSKDILHRDIKPQNVMVTSEGEVKVMDFGIAETVRSSMTRLTGVSSSGTLAYMSPEQLRGKEVIKESDVYSFAAMLYDLLAGHPPFYRGDIHYQILNEKPEKIGGISEWMNDLLQKCLEKDYRTRYNDFESLINLIITEKVDLNAGERNIYHIIDDAKKNQVGTLTDFDGNTYKTVKIGKQIWMAENLKVGTFRNGEPIPEAKTKKDWKRAGKERKPVWCYYDNDPDNGKIYGKLYNWFAVADSRGLAPEGWHIPTYEEWIQLIGALGGEDFAGSKMKSTNLWYKYGYGSNESGFSGLPSGYRDVFANYRNITRYGDWWSSTEYNIDEAWVHYLFCGNNRVYRDYGDKRYGFSVRCLRD